jgi:hypothetical protein
MFIVYLSIHIHTYKKLAQEIDKSLGCCHLVGTWEGNGVVPILVSKLENQKKKGYSSSLRLEDSRSRKSQYFN